MMNEETVFDLNWFSLIPGQSQETAYLLLFNNFDNTNYLDYATNIA